MPMDVPRCTSFTHGTIEGIYLQVFSAVFVAYLAAIEGSTWDTEVRIDELQARAYNPELGLHPFYSAMISLVMPQFMGLARELERRGYLAVEHRSSSCKRPGVYLKATDKYVRYFGRFAS